MSAGNEGTDDQARDPQPADTGPPIDCARLPMKRPDRLVKFLDSHPEWEAQLTPQAKAIADSARDQAS